MLNYDEKKVVMNYCKIKKEVMLFDKIHPQFNFTVII
jgi:hypothetical protein